MVRVPYDIINEKPLLAFLGGLDFIVMKKKKIWCNFFAKKRVQITCYKKIEFFKNQIHHDYDYGI